MAKKGSKKKPDPDWWKSFAGAPSLKQWRQFQRQQRQQFNPLIRFYQREAGKDVGADPIVARIASMIGAEPTAEAVSGRFDTATDKIRQLIASTDFGAAGRSVGQAVEAIGGALGVEGAAQMGEAAGRVSGIGEGQDVFSQAITAGVAADYKRLEKETLKERADRLMQLGLSKAEAEKAARDEKKQARLSLAELRSQRRGLMAQDPFEQAMRFMQFGEALRGYQGYGAGGYGAASTDATGDGEIVGSTAPEILRWLQSPTGGGYGVVGRGGLGSESAAAHGRPPRGYRRPAGSRTPNY